MKPRVLHVVTALDFGGVEKHMETIRQVSGVGAFHHDFCAIAGGGAVADRLAAAGTAPILLNRRPRIPSLPALTGLLSQLRADRPAVLHCHGAEANFHGLIAGRLAGVPVRLGEEIGIPSHSPLAKRIFRLAYRCADAVVAISNAVEEWLVSNGEVSRRQVVRLYNPVALPLARSQAPQADAPFTIGFVGRLHEVKNPAVLIEAVARLRQQAIAAQLVLVGDGPQLVMLQQMAEQASVGASVTFAGYQADPWSHLAACHIYVQPSLAEGFGLALVEAMGFGLPVIATRVGGAPEIVQPGVSGWLVDPGIEGVATALLEAYRLGPSRLEAMGRAAQESVEVRFAPEPYLRDLEALYLSIADRKGISLFGSH